MSHSLGTFILLPLKMKLINTNQPQLTILININSSQKNEIIHYLHPIDIFHVFIFNIKQMQHGL
jgi:hypothetical protein